MTRKPLNYKKAVAGGTAGETSAPREQQALRDEAPGSPGASQAQDIFTLKSGEQVELRLCPPCGHILHQQGNANAPTMHWSLKRIWNSLPAIVRKKNLEDSQQMVHRQHIEIEKLKKELEAGEQSKRSQQQAIDQLNRRNAALESERDKLNKRLLAERQLTTKLQHEVDDHQYRAEELLKETQKFKAQVKELNTRVQDVESEVGLLEERLSEANRQTEQLESELHEAKTSAQPAEHRVVTPSISFEVGFGAQEQSALLNGWALRAERLTHTLNAKGSGATGGVANFMRVYAKSSMDVCKSLRLLDEEPHIRTQATQAVLQHALLQASFSLAMQEIVPSYQRKLRDPLLSHMKDFVPHNEWASINLLSVDVQVCRGLYLLGKQQLDRTGMPHQPEHAPGQQILTNAYQQMALQLSKDVQLPHKQHEHVWRDLLSLVQHATLASMLNFSLGAQLHTMCEIKCDAHVGQEWDPVTMEPPVKELHVPGINSRVVLACTRPSLQFTPPGGTPRDDATGLAAGVLIKAQVVVMVPAPQPLVDKPVQHPPSVTSASPQQQPTHPAQPTQPVPTYTTTSRVEHTKHGATPASPAAVPDNHTAAVGQERPASCTTHPTSHELQTTPPRKAAKKNAPAGPPDFHQQQQPCCDTPGHSAVFEDSTTSRAVQAPASTATAPHQFPVSTAAARSSSAAPAPHKTSPVIGVDRHVVHTTGSLVTANQHETGTTQMTQGIKPVTTAVDHTANAPPPSPPHVAVDLLSETHVADPGSQPIQLPSEPARYTNNNMTVPPSPSRMVAGPTAPVPTPSATPHQKPTTTTANYQPKKHTFLGYSRPPTPDPFASLQLNVIAAAAAMRPSSLASPPSGAAHGQGQADSHATFCGMAGTAATTTESPPTATVAPPPDSGCGMSSNEGHIHSSDDDWCDADPNKGDPMDTSCW